MEIDEQANGTQIRLPVGALLTVSLTENPTTGFTWAVIHSGEPACVPVDETVHPAAAGLAGSGRVHRWRLRAAVPGKARLELAYRRAWERTSPAARVFSVEVYVVSSPPAESGDERDLPEV